MIKFNQSQIDIIKETIKDSIIDCELELGGLFDRFSKADENNVCDFSKCYQELLEKFKSEKAIYEESSWEFDDEDVIDHWQQTMIDYLYDDHNIEIDIDDDEDYDFIINLIDEVFKNMMKS